MSKFKRINGGLQHKLGQMAKFGQSKHKAKKVEREKYLQQNGNLKGFNPTKVEGIYSIQTMESYRSAAETFAHWLAENTTVKNASQIKKEHCERYLKWRNTYCSAWTVSLDMAMINKLHDFGLTKKSLDLRERCQSDIKRSRYDCRNDRYIDRERYAQQIDFARGCGCRSQSILRVTANDIEWKNGRAVGVHLIEKGGRERTAPILNEYKDRIGQIAENALENDPTGTSPLFTETSKYLDIHSFRSDYAAKLFHQLENERAMRKPLFDGDFDPERLINLRGSDKSDDPIYRGHSRSIVAIVSNSLGHSRLRVVFDHYMHKY